MVKGSKEGWGNGSYNRNSCLEDEVGSWRCKNGYNEGKDNGFMSHGTFISNNDSHSLRTLAMPQFILRHNVLKWACSEILRFRKYKHFCKPLSNKFLIIIVSFAYSYMFYWNNIFYLFYKIF